MTYKEINKSVGNLDLFLLDQILKGRFDGTNSILDVGCGEGRNLRYFTKNNYNVTGIDIYDEALQMAKLQFRGKANFLLSDLTSFSSQEKFDVVLCINVLHHAKDQKEFLLMWKNVVDNIKPGGGAFIRTLLSEDDQPFQTDPENNLLISKNFLQALIEENNLIWLEALKVESWENKDLAVIILEKP